MDKQLREGLPVVANVMARATELNELIQHSFRRRLDLSKIFGEAHQNIMSGNCGIKKVVIIDENMGVSQLLLALLRAATSPKSLRL